MLFIAFSMRFNGACLWSVFSPTNKVTTLGQKTQPQAMFLKLLLLALRDRNCIFPIQNPKFKIQNLNIKLCVLLKTPPLLFVFYLLVEFVVSEHIHFGKLLLKMYCCRLSFYQLAHHDLIAPHLPQILLIF